MAFLPPISSVTFLPRRAALVYTFKPVVVEPVNEIIRTSGCSTSAEPVCLAPVTTFNTPEGSPASSNARANAAAEAGTSSPGFQTIVLPATSAGKIFHEGTAIGKFQGVINP